MTHREHASPPFQAHELVDHLKKAMAPAGAASDPARLRGFQVSDRLYVAETDVTAERGFLQGRCRPEEIESVIDDPHGAAQHYLEIRVTTTGELVTTAFLRVTIRGRSLSLDFAACALTRTPVGYQVLDGFAESGTGAVLRSALRGLRDLPDTVGGLWRLGEIPWMLARAAWARKDRTIAPRRRATIGTRLSVREEKSTLWDEAELDKITIYDEFKIIERRLLKATEDFLETKEVDTSMFKRQIFSIINTGVFNMGKLEMSRTVVGTNAAGHYGADGMNGTTNEAPTADGERS
jgi:hypothetical protein